jgi:phage-related minor tail protein
VPAFSQDVYQSLKESVGYGENGWDERKSLYSDEIVENGEHKKNTTDRVRGSNFFVMGVTKKIPHTFREKD